MPAVHWVIRPSSSSRKSRMAEKNTTWPLSPEGAKKAMAPVGMKSSMTQSIGMRLSMPGGVELLPQRNTLNQHARKAAGVGRSTGKRLSGELRLLLAHRLPQCGVLVERRPGAMHVLSQIGLEGLHFGIERFQPA